MLNKLAVITPKLGSKSETFIRRHIQEISPGNTVVVVRKKVRDYDGSDDDIPSLILTEEGRWRWRYNSACFALHLHKLSPEQISVKRFLTKHGVEVILSEYLDRSLNWLDVARDLGIPFYAHAHGYDISSSMRDPEMRREYLRLEAADGIITINEVSRERLIALGLSGNKIHIIPCGVDVPDAPIVRSASKTVRYLAVGRMVPKKGPLFTLEAFHKALDKHPGLQLDFIGNGELLDEAIRFVRDRGMEASVIFHGQQENNVVLKLMNSADVFLQHSLTDPATGNEEGLPVAILEAMAHSLPVVSTRHAGIPEAVVENETGYLVDEGDIESMAEYIVRLASDSNLRNQLGHAGWQRARMHFSSQGEIEALKKCMKLEKL